MAEYIPLNVILQATDWNEFAINFQEQFMHYDKSVEQFTTCNKLFKTTTLIH